MKKNYKVIFLLIFSCTFLSLDSFSQTTNIWYFGNHAGIDFNSGSPVPLTNGALNSYEGCATICNNAGALLFYTDGTTIYDATHNIMLNGMGLNGNPNSTQSSLIIPFPSSPDSFYVFTTEYCGGPFSYSVVDMTLAGGLGGVTIKNNVLLASSTEKLTAVKAANGTDYWVVVHENGNALFYAYYVFPIGISAPVVSTAGSIITGLDCAGTMKLNPQGTQIAVTMEQSWTYELYDFNKTTGYISNQRILGPLSDYTYSCEFSPNGHFLYGVVDPSATALLCQYDVTLGSAAAINSSLVIVGGGNDFFNFGILQNGPDGKIYVVRENKDSLGVINYPNLQGIACNWVNKGVPLAGNTCTLGLPNFITSYFDVTTEVPTPNQANPDLLLFPNPVTTQSALTFANKGNDKMFFYLYDITGRIIEWQSTTKNELIITKGNKPVGVYLFKLVNEQTGTCMNGKIVIAH